MTYRNSSDTLKIAKRFMIGVIKISATIKDVAKYTGLSIATISKYLNGGNVLEKNRIKIEEAIRELNFRRNELARGLKTNQTMTVGILIPTLENNFFTTIISHIENILLKNRYSTIICVYREDFNLEKEKLSFLVNKKVDGIIMAPHGRDWQHIQQVLDQDIPVVLIDRMIKELECDTILTDNSNAAYNAVEQFIIGGHRRIGIITGHKDIYTTAERLKGYIRVHEDYGLEIDESLILYGNYDVESGYSQLEKFIKMKNPPTAVFVTNYDMTLGAVMAINENNIRIPDQLSFIGFDNLQLARVIKPAPSIVVQPMEGIGKLAAKTLLNRMKGDKVNFPSVYRLKTKLIIGDSIRPLMTEIDK